jgi:hypothetical protein
MDPDANLNEQLLLAARLRLIAMTRQRRNLTADEDAEVYESADRLAELVEALNRWLSVGGFLPSRWSNH